MTLAEDLLQEPAEAELRDPLLDCLEHVAAWHGLDFCAETAIAGLPLIDGRLSPGLLLRAAERSGLRAQLVERSLRAIPSSVLPAILLLHGDDAGVLLPGVGGEGEFILPGRNPADPIDLKRSYTGFAVLLQPHVSAVQEEAPNPKWWFWRTMWQFREYYLRLVPAAFLIAVLGLIMPLFTMLVYDRVVPHDASETLWVLALGAGGVFCFDFLLRLLRGSILARSGREVDTVLASTLFQQLLGLEMQARPPEASVLAARIKSYEVLRDFFMSAALLALVDLPFCFLMLAAVFFIGGPVGWIVVIAASAAIFSGLLLQMPLRRSVQESAETSLERQALVAESVNGLESVKGANAEGVLQHRFESVVAGAAERDVRMHRYSLLATSTTGTIVNLTNVAVVVAAVYRVHAGEMSMGGMIACLMLSSRTMLPIAMVAGLMTRLQQSLQALHSLNRIMELPREIGGERRFLQRHIFHFNFALNDVTVRYPGQALPALSGITVGIQEGQRVALVGRMGSGKSTLLRLLAKLYEPSEGGILLDGVELGQYHPAVVRHHIGYLAQDAAVFSGTIRDNVTMAGRGVTDAEVAEALRLAGLDDYVKRNPRGIHAPVGEQGSLLSGGQRRALVLARCFLTRPRLLLLDEPLANMDPQSEKEFIQALHRYLEQDKRRTLVVVTHKTTVLSVVDHMIVLNEGKVFLAGEKEAVLSRLGGGAQPPSLRGGGPAGVAMAAMRQLHPEPAAPVRNAPSI